MSNKSYYFMVVVFHPKEVLHLSFAEPGELESHMAKHYPNRHYEVRDKDVRNY